MQSETIGKLAEALSKAQKEMDAARKDSKNPFFKSTYADLASIIEALKPLSEHGLSYAQYLDGMNLITTLMHSSGEWISGSLSLLLAKPDMQSLGSAITYARRYSLSAIAGITQDDDDGNNTLSDKEKESLKQQNKDVHPQFKLTKDDKEAFAALVKTNGYTHADVLDYLSGKQFFDLTQSEYLQLQTVFGIPKGNKGGIPV